MCKQSTSSLFVVCNIKWSEPLRNQEATEAPPVKDSTRTHVKINDVGYRYDNDEEDDDDDNHDDNTVENRDTPSR